MHRWRMGYGYELNLLLYRRKAIMFWVVSAILPILLAVSLNALQPILGVLAGSTSFPIEMLTIYTSIWIPLFIIMVTADLFPNEVASRTLKLVLVRPNTRFQVFAAKVAALGTGIAILLVTLAIAASVCSLFSGAAVSFSEGLSIVKAYTAAFFPMLAMAALFVFLSQFFKSAGGFMVFAIVLYAAAKVMPFVSSSFAVFSPTAYTNWHMLWISSTVSAGKLFTSSLFLISACVLFFSLGYYKFDRKEA